MLRYLASGALPWSDARRLYARTRSLRLATKFEADLFHNIVVEDPYGVRRRPSMVRGGRVLDVGAHIGTFSLLCHAAGAAEILACEPHPSLHLRLRQHLSPLPGIRAARTAVFRSDLETKPRLFHSGFVGANSGGGNVLFGGRSHWWWGLRGEPDSVPDDPPPVTSLDELIAERPVKLLKLDCEGSEFPILFTSRRLHLVERIVAEVHDVDEPSFARLVPAARVGSYRRYHQSDLVTYLETQGYTVTARRTGGPIGQLWAIRSRSSVSTPPAGRRRDGLESEVRIACGGEAAGTTDLLLTSP